MEKEQYIDIELVKSIMKEKDIDEKALASGMEVTLATIKIFLNGADQHYLSTIFVYKLSRVLGAAMEQLLRKEYRKVKNV
ncbi:MAG: hypothetical protein FWE84_04770 [Firmicutes bacterium]|nr:hypothetical protein [Bacillota bacterium]